jgi:hypothetical protein
MGTGSFRGSAEVEADLKLPVRQGDAFRSKQVAPD